MTPKRRKTLIAALVAALAVAAGVWVAVGRGGAQSSTPSPITTEAPQGKAESSCGLSGTRGTPTTLPATWENIAGWSLPISATDGPAVRSRTGAWSCYARTPAGAVLAGYVIPLRVDGLAEDWKTAVREQTLPGPAQSLKLRSTPPQASDHVSVRGFSVAAYSDTTATIAYYLHTDTMEASCTADVAWFDHDWRLKLQDDGDTFSGCSQGVPASFVPWGPT